MNRKQQIIATVDDLVSGFLYYDRKDADPELLQLGDIEDAVERGEISAEEIIERFAMKLKEHLL